MASSNRIQAAIAVATSYILYKYLQTRQLPKQQRCNKHNASNCLECCPLASMIDPIERSGTLPCTPEPPSLLFEQLLIKSLPLAYQTTIRDSGWFGTIADIGAVVLGTIFFCRRPYLFIWFMSRYHVQHHVKFSDQSNRLYCDVYHHGTIHSNKPAQPTNNKQRKVIIFTHGGAWSSGNKFIYRLVGRTLRDAGYIVVIPNYRVFPYVKSSDDQCNDINQCLYWTYNNIYKYNGDPDNIFLCGHSSGGHINTLLTYRRITPLNDYHSIQQYKDIPIRGLINMGAPFDITDHYAFEHARGVVVISPMTSSNGGSYEKTSNYSPTQLVQKLTESQLLQLPPMLQVHAMSDVTVPPSSSERYAAALTRAGIHSTRCPVYLLNSPADHVTPILDIMLKQNTCQTQINIINQFIDEFSIDSSHDVLTHQYDTKHIKHETLESIELPSHL